MTASTRLPLLAPHLARRPYGNAIQVRTAVEIRAIEAREARTTLIIRLAALAVLGLPACLLVAAYLAAVLDGLGWL